MPPPMRRGHDLTSSRPRLSALFWWRCLLLWWRPSHFWDQDAGHPGDPRRTGPPGVGALSPRDYPTPPARHGVLIQQRVPPPARAISGGLVSCRPVPRGHPGTGARTAQRSPTLSGPAAVWHPQCRRALSWWGQTSPSRLCPAHVPWSRRAVVIAWTFLSTLGSGIASSLSMPGFCHVPAPPVVRIFCSKRCTGNGRRTRTIRQPAVPGGTAR